jgi:hypothetical protein
MEATQPKKRTGGRYSVEWKIPYFMIPHHLTKLTETGLQTLLLIYLMECSQYGHGEIYASFKTMAENCHCNERTIRRTIPELAELGLIEVTPRSGRTSLIHITIKGVTYTEPRTECPNTPDRMSAPPRTPCPTSNKEASNKELYKRVDKIKLSDKTPPPRDPEVVKRLAMEPHARVYRDVDKETELIPLENIGHKLPGNIKDVLGKIKGDIESRRAARNKAPQALKSKSRARKR